MIKRPKRGDTEEDILRMQQEFLLERAKNPKMQPAAQVVKMGKPPKKSLFARSRQQQVQLEQSVEMKDMSGSSGGGDMQVGGKTSQEQRQQHISDIVLGDIVEKVVSAPKRHLETRPLEAIAFPRVEKSTLNESSSLKSGKSLFAQSMEAKAKASPKTKMTPDAAECGLAQQRNLSEVYGAGSAIVEDPTTAAEVHEENLRVLSRMDEEEILAERRKLMESIDPAIVALLARKRQEMQLRNEKTNASSVEPMDTSPTTETKSAILEELPPSNAAVELIQRSSAEHWIHFDVVEKDKLEWMRDVPLEAAKLKPGEKFEARFDWKGVLLPYTTTDPKNGVGKEKDERELYLHGDEPHRPGYTLQELFRLARSNVLQQRISAFGAIGGILNIYQQGFYDNVLELPISKIFFLLRFGFDDNSPAMLEVISKALAYLFYNETDETLLDFTFDNPGCHWQPTLQVLTTETASDDPTSIENLQQQMQQLQTNAKSRLAGAGPVRANVEESEAESKTSMSDFQLAETDLIECLLRTNILQRIYFILNTVRPDNSTVGSCLKLLIRLARSGKEVATQIVNNTDLIDCLYENFLPGLECVDTFLQTPPYYHYPQHLCLKLWRILICSNLGIALQLTNDRLINILENYLFNREDIKGQLIRAQIECLRILKCLFLLHLDGTLYKKFLPAFRYMLQWHYDHVVFEEGGPFLIRQHAAALLMALTCVSGPVGHEVTTMMADVLHDCCCNWFHKATRYGVKEFSQATLLSACVNAVTWYTRNSLQASRFRNFNDKYLRDFIASEGFVKFVQTLVSSSIVLRQFLDRRIVHAPLPNVGAVVLHSHGPQLVVTQTYAFYLLTALWRLMELELEQNEKRLFEALLKVEIVESLVLYLRTLTRRTNRYLATNFFAKIEIKFIFKLLRCDGFREYLTKAELLQVVYNFLCCLTAEHIPEIEELFQHVIFNTQYLAVEEETLNKWRNTCLELVYPHYIVVSPAELTLSMPFSQAPILPKDWPYFQLKILLQNYIENVQQKPTSVFSEREVLQMTFTFVTQLEECNAELQIVTPTEKLMYFMIAFMGPDSQFLDGEMHEMLHRQLLRFYDDCKEHEFQFDQVYEGKCKFENLYALFVDHFQAASYGDELFGSLVMVPLAQKYDNKWRRRVWSDYASALRFLNCDESLLIGGLAAYLEPAEQEESLLKAYASALNSNLLRIDTLPYKIARHHVEQFKQRPSR